MRVRQIIILALLNILILHFKHFFLDFESFQVPEIRLIYSTKKEFEAAARKIGVMSDLKAGVPRMAYFGVVTALYKNIRVFITPPNPRVWEYHTDW